VADLVGLLRKLSNHLQIIEYLERMNLWEDMVYFLLEEGVTSADQFGEQDFVEGLKKKLKGSNMNLGNIRPCRWKPSCYEFDTALKDKAHIIMTIGPQIPLIPEYRSALLLFPQISEYLNKTFVIDTGKKSIQVSNWKELLTTAKSESFRGSSLQRYKGLGEMNPEQLWETTMHPEKRTLLQVNIEDAENADDIFITLMGEKVEPRREFIQNHALEVKELDI
jgi:DNA gyrase subunit B